MAKKKSGWRSKLVLVFALTLAAIFTSTSVVLLCGMLPTIVAFFVDRSQEKLKPLTVGAMNFSGCFPFLMELWVSGENTVVAGMEIVQEPKTIVIMYMAALIGYLIDWSVSGMVAQIIQQKGRARLKEIGKIQESLINRWGEKVQGNIPLDDDGFPLEMPQDEKK